MKQYEYKTHEASTEDDWYRNSRAEKEYLNKEGKDGWRLVCAFSIAMGNATLYYWEKELPAEEQK